MTLSRGTFIYRRMNCYHSLTTLQSSTNRLPVLTLVKSIRQPLEPSTPTLYAPSFSHALKDPVYDDIPISPTARIVIFEGNYLSLNTSPWSDAAKLMDELWYAKLNDSIRSDFEPTRI